MIKQNAKAALHRNVVAQGQKLYGEAQAEFDGLTNYLKAGLTTRFSGHDPKKIATRIKDATDKASQFIAWCDSPKNDQSCCAGSGSGDWDTPLSFISAWLDGVRKDNQAAIDQLRNDLDACRFRDWKLL
jgi:hypothetical protein